MNPLNQSNHGDLHWQMSRTQSKGYLGALFPLNLMELKSGKDTGAFPCASKWNLREILTKGKIIKKMLSL